MEADSRAPSPPPDSAETLGAVTPNTQSSSPNSDYFSPRSDDGSPELYKSPLQAEDAPEGRGSEAEGADEVFNSSPRSAFYSDSKCHGVDVKSSESESPLPLNCDDKPSESTDAGLVPNPSLSIEQMQNIRPVVAGSGLVNLGNTCFLNSVLQCFIHTVPLLHGILSNKHSMYSRCGHGEFCLLCSLRQLVEYSLACRIILPCDFVDNLSYFSSNFQKYQQEDAHEFLQSFLDRLESCDLKQREWMPSQHDNIVKQVFGGRLVSKLKCCSCGHYSNTYEPSIDLSLEIEDADNLLTALQSFTKVEKLEDPETRFTCETCREQVSVEKQLSFDQAPPVGVFHLKRFKSDGCLVQKIDKHVSFPLELDLLPFTDSGKSMDEGLKYVLYAIVVHVGLTSTSGHYYCFIRLAPNLWCKFDDSQVALVHEDFVLSQEAYILFYAKENMPWFSIYVETMNLGLEPTIWNKSPKSVLDSAALTSPTVQDKFPSDPIEATDDTAGEPRVGKIEIQYSRSARNNIESNEAKDDSVSVVPIDHDSLDASVPDPPKEVSPLNQSLDASVIGNSQDVIQSPTRSASPEIYREDPPDAGFSIPREHLRLVDRHSCKRRLEKYMDDMETKQACTFVKKTIPSSRAQQLLSALQNSKTEAPVSRKKGRRSDLSNSASTRDCSSIKNTRSLLAGTYRVGIFENEVNIKKGKRSRRRRKMALDR